MYVSGGIDEKALNISNDVVHIIEQLRSLEEADTRMLLHVAYQARQSAKMVSVASQILMGYQLVTWVYMKYSLKPEGKVPMPVEYTPEGVFTLKEEEEDLTRFIPVHNVVCKLNEDQKNILLSVYALTGCDTCCALFGIGKKKAFKTMMNYSAELQGLADIGK